MPSILAGNGNSYHTYTLDDALSGIAAAGFRHVELSASRWTEHVALGGSWHAVAEKQKDVQRRLEQHGLNAVCLSTHSDIMTPSGLDNALRAVRWSADFGLPVMNTAIGGQLRTADDEKDFLARVAQLGDAAAAVGVTVGLEIYGDIMPSGKKALPLLEQVDHGHIGVNYDTANVEFYSGRKAVDDLTDIMPHVVSVHLKDIVGGQGSWNFPAIGRGDVDFDAVLGLLYKAGYTGPMSVEIEFQGEPWPHLGAVDRSMQESFQYLQALRPGSSQRHLPPGER